MLYFMLADYFCGDLSIWDDFYDYVFFSDNCMYLFLCKKIITILYKNIIIIHICTVPWRN